MKPTCSHSYIKTYWCKKNSFYRTSGQNKVQLKRLIDHSLIRKMMNSLDLAHVNVCCFFPVMERNKVHLLNTVLDALYWVLPFSATLYFYCTTFLRIILYFSLHFCHGYSYFLYNNIQAHVMSSSTILPMYYNQYLTLAPHGWTITLKCC